MRINDGNTEAEIFQILIKVSRGRIQQNKSGSTQE